MYLSEVFIKLFWIHLDGILNAYQHKHPFFQTIRPPPLLLVAVVVFGAQQVFGGGKMVLDLLNGKQLNHRFPRNEMD
jgi:hypothetical protein